MTLSHLIQLKPRLLFCKIRFSQPTKCGSSSTSMSGTEKKSSVLRKRNASVVETCVNKYMNTHPGISRTVTLGQNEIGRSFHTMKDIMLNLKEKLIGKSGASSQSSGPKKCEVSASESNLRDGNNLSASPTETLKESLTLEKKDMDATTKDIKTCSNLANSEPRPIKSSVQSSIQTPVKKSHIIKKTACEASLNRIDFLGKISKINEKDHDIDIMDSSGSLKMVGALNGPLQSGESSKLISKLKKCDTEPQVKKIWHGIVTEKLSSTESVSQSDKIVFNSEFNLGSENETGKSERTGLYSNPAQKDMGLQELIMTCLNEWPAVNPKQPDEAFSGTLLQSEIDPNSKSAQSQTRKLSHQFNEQMVTEMKGESQSESAKKKDIRLKQLLKKRADHPEAGEMMTGLKREILTRNIFKDSSSSEPQEEVAKDSNISGLINCLKKLPLREQSGIVQPQGSINNSLKHDMIGEVQSQDEPQPSDNKGKQTLLNGQAMVEKKEKERGLVIEVAPSNVKSTSNTKVPLLGSKKAESCVKPVLEENKALLRFVHKTVEEYAIAVAFKNRDDIVKIECFSTKGSMFKTAHVYFKTQDALQEALKTTYLIIKNDTVTIEAASSLENLSNRICIPDLIGDPDAPVMLLKNPSKTVMVKDLTDDISSHHIQEALLAVYMSEISAFFFGSSNYVAYVEFKTEEEKERALEQHSILLQGKPLSIFRVDIPRTTVIRISHVKKVRSVMNEIAGLCKSYGQVKSVLQRDDFTVDVHFLITEWPNMLKILNRLNGQMVNGDRLQAKAAPVFPPEIIHALWGHPEERRRLKGLMRNLIQKLEEDYVANTDIVHLAARYYRDDED